MKLLDSRDRPVCRLRDVFLSRGPHFSLHVRQLDIISGIPYILVGRNGSGKSTLLQLIGQSLVPDSGKIELFGQQQTKSSGNPSRLGVASVDQAPFMFAGTVLENVSMGLRFRKVPPGQRKEMASICLADVGLAGFEHRICRELSEGEKKRVALARALVTAPELLLLDEVTAGIDDASREIVDEIVRRQVAEGRTVMMSAHNYDNNIPGCEIIRLESGRIIPDPDQKKPHRAIGD